MRRLTSRTSTISTRMLLINIFIFAFFVPAFSITLGLSLVDYQTKLFTTGSIKSVGISIYSNIDGTDVISSIDWGAIEPGTPNNIVLFVRNEGNIPVTLQLNASNYYPSIMSDFITLSWDYNETALQLNELSQITLILHVSTDIEKTEIETFSFEIMIYGNG